ncbi:DUF481 domain-containing protein [Parasphingorhabdus cellanae]|uniref:DUF481 domain-containing protein n=1 Tax=Parasphingorhabdus cellanae TaxID=2806553 RepID=A0ABX7T304_9SPHN|nr:DUF481 domain-containing protein [Parasphingorhabdus cellanae]QTD55921.1 DUF481 domain-containing protein [Parasphingorhabdus cellanae]
MKKYILTLLSLTTIMTPSTGFAQEQQSAESMIDAAIANGDTEAVDAIAKYANSEAVTAKVEAYKADLAAKEAAEIAERNEAGFFSNWEGTGELGAFQSGGNTTSVGVTAGVKLTKESERWRFKFNALADYQRTNGSTTREQGVVTLEPNYKFNDRLYAFGLVQYERDRFQGFSSRYTLSGGLGYKLINTDAMQLEAKAGPAWRKTDLVGGGSNSRIAGLAAVNYAWKVSPAITFNQDLSAYVQSGNSSYNSLSALNAKLGDKLTARLSYQVDHETNPPAGLEKTDTFSRATLIFGF